MPPQSRLSDMCVHGNAIVSGSPDTIVGGMLAARKGDLVGPCPIPEPPGKIVSGSSTVFINSCAAARIGDKVACGAAGAPPGGGSVSGVSTYAVKPEDNYVEAVFRDDSFLLQEKPSEDPKKPPPPDVQPPREAAGFLDGLSLDIDLGSRSAGSGAGGGPNAVALGEMTVIVGG